MDPLPPISFRQWLRQQRLSHGWTQEDLAIQSNCGLQSIRRFERGEGRPSKRVADLLAVCFAVPEADRAAFVHWARNSLDLTPPSSITRPLNSSPADSHATGTPQFTLPIPATPLIGRTADVEQIRGVLAHPDVRLLTITGPGGVGKTRLALAVAHAQAEEDSVTLAFVPLAAIRDPRTASSAIRQALAALALRATPVASKHLLVLDNFEHLIEAAADISQALAHDPQLQILVTSREVLNLYGEYIFSAPMLELPQVEGQHNLDTLREVPAVRLLVQRAQAVRPDFAITAENALAVVEICRQLDGLPLALELAAARLKTMTPHALLPRLLDRFAVLTRGPRDLPPRQQTLRATLDWSYHLLEPDEQRLFAQLAVFVGGFTVEAAAAICDPAPDPLQPMLDRLEALVNKSLLRQGVGISSEPRFGMLEIIREYAEVRLEESGDTDRLRERHAAYFVHLVETLLDRVPDLETEMRWAILEHANLHALTSWAGRYERSDLIVRLGNGLWAAGLGIHLEAANVTGWQPAP
jgi:predicted ATPase/transcriptional regulator with XRE-family HTH domain